MERRGRVSQSLTCSGYSADSSIYAPYSSDVEAKYNTSENCGKRKVRGMEAQWARRMHDGVVGRLATGNTTKTS